MKVNAYIWDREFGSEGWLPGKLILAVLIYMSTILASYIVTIIAFASSGGTPNPWILNGSAITLGLLLGTLVILNIKRDIKMNRQAEPTAYTFKVEFTDKHKLTKVINLLLQQEDGELKEMGQKLVKGFKLTPLDIIKGKKI